MESAILAGVGRVGMHVQARSCFKGGAQVESGSPFWVISYLNFVILAQNHKTSEVQGYSMRLAKSSLAMDLQLGGTSESGGSSRI